nr:sulfate transporter 1.3-like [Ipomoea batatas]
MKLKMRKVVLGSTGKKTMNMMRGFSCRTDKTTAVLRRNMTTTGSRASVALPRGRVLHPPPTRRHHHQRPTLFVPTMQKPRATFRDYASSPPSPARRSGKALLFSGGCSAAAASLALAPIRKGSGDDGRREKARKKPPARRSSKTLLFSGGCSAASLALAPVRNGSGGDGRREKARKPPATAAVASTLSSSNTHVFQVVVMRVSLHCQGCASKVKKHLSKMEGVTSFSIDLENKKVTVMGNVSPAGVLESVSKINNTNRVHGGDIRFQSPKTLVHLCRPSKLFCCCLVTMSKTDDDEGAGPSSSHSIDISANSGRRSDSLPYVHKVGVPPKQSWFDEFKATVKETFFHDDPLRQFKDQSLLKKLFLGIQAVFPILEWGRSYNLSKLKGDLIAGLTIASLCIPQDIGYAKLANLDPQFGLYSSFVPPLIYAFMGSSRDIAIGPVAVVSLLLGNMLQNEIDPVKQKLEYQRLAFTATFFAGITQFVLGFFRLGFLIDFLSHAAIVGFMGGAGITIALQQLKGLLGIEKFTKKTDLISVMKSVWGSVHHGWNWQTIVIGVTFLAFLLAAKYIGKKSKKFFWVPAIAPLISVIISTFSVYITHAEKHGVKIVNHIEKGINPSSVNKLYFSGDYLAKGFRIGAIAGMVALTEATAIGRTFAAMKDYQIDGNKEMVALGTMNVVGSLTSCYIATGSFSRSAVNYMAGCHTAVSNIVMSLVVLLTLELITPLFKYTPNAILASIIISAVAGIIDIPAMVLIWKIDKFDFVACMGAFLGVIFHSVEIGLLIAVAISFAKILLQVTRPRIAVLGRIPRTNVYRNIQQYPDATRIPGILIVRVDSAIYFSNSNYARDRILRWLSDEEEKLNESNSGLRVQYLIVEMSPNPGPTVMAKLHASNLASMIGEDRIFLRISDAVLTFAARIDPENDQS